jgi:hypothetical protein
MLHRIYLLALVLGCAALSAPAHAAGLAGVKDIRVSRTHTDNDIQVVELQAIESASGANVALATRGAVATSSSMFWFGAPLPAKAIDGQYQDKSYPNMFHSSGRNKDDWLNISFDAPKDLSSVTMYGRSDCCAYRDVYKLEFLDAKGKLLHTAFLDAHNAAHKGSIVLPESAPAEEPDLAPRALLAGVLLAAGVMGAAFVRRQRARGPLAS